MAAQRDTPIAVTVEKLPCLADHAMNLIRF